MNYWLFKTEPDEFGIKDLAAAPGQTASWEGVRNYQARNFLRDQVRCGDKVFIYHSSCKQIGIAGIARVSREAYPDRTQFAPDSDYYDPKARVDEPRWWMVDVTFETKFKQVLSLDKIKSNPSISALPLVKKGHRLSVMPVQENEWQTLLTMAQD